MAALINPTGSSEARIILRTFQSADMIAGPLNLHTDQSIMDMMTRLTAKDFLPLMVMEVGNALPWIRTWLLWDLVAYLVEWLKSSFLRGLTLGWLHLFIYQNLAREVCGFWVKILAHDQNWLRSHDLFIGTTAFSLLFIHPWFVLVLHTSSPCCLNIIFTSLAIQFIGHVHNILELQLGCSSNLVPHYQNCVNLSSGYHFTLIISEPCDLHCCQWIWLYNGIFYHKPLLTEES